MSIPTRAELEALKRTALQAKCKELGIKANSKSELLIDLVLEHYQSTSGPSKPSTSSKRKAQDDAKARRVKPKIEPQDALPLQTSPRRGKVMEVVMRTPGRGKGKAKAMTPVDDEVDVVKGASASCILSWSGVFGLAITTAQPLGPTSATSMDHHRHCPLKPHVDPQDTRVADLELQIRNARKAGDESAREILALKAFQNAVQQAFGDHSSSDTLDSMGQLAKLRDLAPRLVELSHIDPDASFKSALVNWRSEKPTVAELEVMVRQLQSQFNRIPDSVFDNNRPEDSASDSRYTIIRPASAAPTAGPSNPQCPSSQEESLFPPQNQDQNSGRALSAAKSSRGSRPPLVEKEKEVETGTDARRSVLPSSQSSRPSTQSSRARSLEPYSRQRSSSPPTPSRGKGKGRLIKTLLDTVNEDEALISVIADPFTPTVELPRSPPTVVRKSRSPSPSAGKPSPSSSSLPPLPTLGTNGPIAELPFKLIASPSKPSAAPPSSEATARPAAPSGRVGRATLRPHQASVRRTKISRSTVAESRPIFDFALPGGSTTSTTNAATSGPSASANRGHVFITPERLGANFSLFPSTRIDLGRTPGGLAFKTTGRAPPGTPAVTNTLFGTEVARDTRFADLPYDPDASRASISWEEPVWPAGIPRNAANP
ncbi:hypothetical protein OPQ81_010249 [Rhizoctonia solani]|nr:hypothetical protein OPQ81_010249 [Rhizoctonia solani]